MEFLLYTVYSFGGNKSAIILAFVQIIELNLSLYDSEK